MNRSRYFLALVTFLLSCKKDIGKQNHGDYPHDIGHLISSNCSVSGCHNGTSYQAAGGYNLETWHSMFSGAGNGSPVIPYSSKFSSLCYFINTYDSLGPRNIPTMPLNRMPLPASDVQMIKDWIDQGAPDINGQVMWADNGQRRKVYVVNQGCDVVTVIDAATRLPMRYINVGNKPNGPDTPHHLRVSPDGQYWYVIFINNNVMQKYRCSDDSYVGDIPLTPFAAGTSGNPDDNALDWNTFVISSDGKRAYCVSWTANGKVAAVDLQNMKLLHYLPNFSYPHGIALSPEMDKIYVTAQTGNYVSELDTGFTDIPRKISFQNGQPPSAFPSLDIHDIIFSPDGASILVTCQGTNQVRVFDRSSEQVIETISTGVYPQEIIYSKAALAYFVSCTNDSVSFPNTMGVVTRISASGYVPAKLACGYQPHGLATDETGRVLYVTSRNILSAGPPPHHSSVCAGRNGFVSFVDIATFKVVGNRYELSVDPYFVFTR